MHIDTRGQKCPIPVLKAQKALETLPNGARLTLVTTDPLAKIDIALFCQQNGHMIHQQTQGEKEMTFEIEKGHLKK